MLAYTLQRKPASKLNLSIQDQLYKLTATRTFQMNIYDIIMNMA